MTSSIVPARASRRTLAECLFRLVENPERPRTATTAAYLLPLFVEPEDIPRLQARLALAEGYVRSGLLRSFARNNWRLDEPCFEALLDRAIAEPSRWRGDQLFDDLIRLPLSDAQRAQVLARARHWNGARARRFLVHQYGSRAHWPAELAPLLYKRALGDGCLDAQLAWTAFERLPSQALLLDGGEALDTRKLRRAIHDWSSVELDALFAGRDERFDEALRELALPMPYLKARVEPARLERTLIAALNDGTDSARASAVYQLSTMPDDSPLVARWLENDTHGHLALQRRIQRALQSRSDSAFLRFSTEELARYLTGGRVDPAERGLYEHAVRRGARLAATGLAALLQLRVPIDTELVELAARSEEPMTQQQAWGYRARCGDERAYKALVEAARSAPHVVLRADALGHLRDLNRAPVELFLRALDDVEVFDMFYAPAQTEAAVALQRQPKLDEERALAALTRAVFKTQSDDTALILHAAIKSWLGGPPVAIRAVWSSRYMTDAFSERAAR